MYCCSTKPIASLIVQTTNTRRLINEPILHRFKQSSKQPRYPYSLSTTNKPSEASKIGSSQLIRECAKEYNADIVEVELKSQFRCNGSDNYLDWLEQVIYNEPVKSSFKEDEFDFKIFDDPQTLYDEIKRKDSIDGQSARLTAGFCWPWSSSLDENGDL